MKNSIKFILILAICTLQFACSTDDDSVENMTDNNPLIGEWLRSDYNVDTNFEYKIQFIEEENSGLISQKTSSGEGVISAASNFNWNINNTILTISQAGEDDIITTFEFSSNGAILNLPGYSNIEFIKQ